jgi:hypothetical protein
MMKSHYQRCLQCFPTQENLTTKTLNPKVTSFVIQVSLFSSSFKNLNRNTYIAVTIGQIVSRLMHTTQGTTNLILKTCRMWKTVSRLNTQKNMLPAKKIVTRFTNRVTIGIFPASQIWRQFFNINLWRFEELSNYCRKGLKLYV